MNVLDFLFRCSHPSYSFPLSVRNGKKCRCYQVCLTCGREFSFDPVAWKRGPEIRERRSA